jgi:hypothetical protein
MPTSSAKLIAVIIAVTVLFFDNLQKAHKW